MSDDTGQSNPSQNTPLANSSDSTWPNSTKLANQPAEALAKEGDIPQEASPSGQSVEIPLANNDSAPSQGLANKEATDSGQVTAPSDQPDSLVPSQVEVTTLANPSIPADSTPTPISVPTDSPSQSPADSSVGSPSPSSPSLPLPSSEPSVSTTGGGISSPSSSDQPSQVQSGPSDSTSSNTTSPNPPDLANIKPETPQASQNPPLANPNSPKVTFGDILRGTQPNSSSQSPSPTSPIPPQSLPTNSHQSKSFGGILAGLDEKVESVLEPTINIPPIETPKPSSPISPPSPRDTSSLRQQANAKRLEKKQKHLDQILALIKETQSITNTDVQRLCRVSQSTATNYLTELEKKGLIKQQGTRGGTKYTL